MRVVFRTHVMSAESRQAAAGWSSRDAALEDLGTRRRLSRVRERLARVVLALAAVVIGVLALSSPASADSIVWGTPDIRYVGVQSTPAPSENIDRAYPENNNYPSTYGWAEVTVSKPLSKILRYCRGFHGTVKMDVVWDKTEYGNVPLWPGYYPSLQVKRFTFFRPSQTLATDYVKLGCFQFVYVDGTSIYISLNGLYAISQLQAAVLGMFPWCGFTDDPVNTSSGNATYSATDLALSGKGLELVFSRSYNSQDGTFDGPLGYGWSHPYQARLLLGNDAGATLVYPDGRQAFFRRQADGSYAQPPTAREELVKNGDNSYTVTSPDETTLSFSSTGCLTGLADRYGNQTTLTYSGNGVLNGIADPGGRSLTISYSGTHISSVTDSASRVVSYGYDAAGNLTTVTDPNGHTTSYTYDSAHQLASIRQPEPSTNPLITNTYTAGRVTEQTDALGHDTQLSYDSGGRLTRSSSGLIARDSFTADSSSQYTQYELFPTTAWSFASGKWKQTNATADAIQRRDSSTTCACATMRAAGTSDASGLLSFPIVGCLAGETTDAAGQIACYRVYTQIGQTWINLGKRADGVSTTLDTDTVAAPTKDTFYLYRVYYDATLGRVYGKFGQTSFTTSLDAADSSLGSGSGCIRAGLSCSFDWLDLRTSHQITCTGLPTGYTFEVSDGTTTAVATESGGTATVDAGAVLFPLGQVRVLDADNQEVTKLTCAELADMGGGDVFCYDEAASLLGETEVIDNNGHASTDIWDPETFRLVRHADPLSHLSSFTYSPRGWLASSTDENNHTTRYGYDTNGNAAAVVDPEGHATRAGYDAKNNPLYLQDALGERLSRTSSGLLSRDDFTTDTLASYTLKPDGYDAQWSISDGTLRYTYANPPGVLCASAVRSGQAGAGCVTARSKIASTDSELNTMLSAAYGAGSGWDGYVLHFNTANNGAAIYKTSGWTWTQLSATSFASAPGSYYTQRLVDTGSTIYALFGTDTVLTNTLTASDSTYVPTAAGVRFGQTSTCDWLEVRTSAIITCTGLPAGYKLEVCDGTTTASATASSGTAVVDAKGLVFPLTHVRVLDAGNQEVANLTSADLADMGGGDVFIYDGSAGHRTTFSWDATGTFLNSVTSPIGTTSFSWNTDGSLDSVTDAENHTWEYGYNTYGDLVSFTDPLSFVTSFEYDAAGRPTAVEDANSSRTEFSYDAVGNVTAVKDPLAETDPLNRHQLDFTYDANDNVTEVEDARGNSTTFGYDDLNRLTLVEDALGGEAAFSYDANHNLVGLEDPRGSDLTFAYDECDRLDTVEDALGELTGFAYDPAGRLTSIARPTGTETSIEYTADGLLAFVSYSSEPTTWAFSYNVTHGLDEVEKNDGKSWAFTYDAGNRLVSASDENNASLGEIAVSWSYDDVSNVTGIDVGSASLIDLTYDARNLVSTVTDAGGETSFAHDDAGRLTEIETPEGSTRSFTYDAAGRPTEVENTTGSGIQTFTYTYDANGNVLAENLRTYGYDALDRLTSWYDPGTDVTTTYAYDRAGNLTEVTVGGVPTESYSFNAANEITDSGFAYDDNGNLTSDGTYTYFYDAANQLVEVGQGETTVCSMTYDYAGRRTSLTTTAGTTYFHWSSGLLAAESDSTGTITATYAWSPEGGLLSMTRQGETYYYQTNAHGDVISVTDDTGTVVNSYVYEPWGSVLSATETVANPFRYASYYYDADTGLYYLWHRYYAPELRRFLTPDLVFGGPLYDPLCFNSYAYVLDNPVSFVDPTGLMPEWVLWIVNPGAAFNRGIELAAAPLAELGQDAVEYYAETSIETDNPWVEAACELGGGVAALFTPETWDKTVTVLSLGLGAGVALRGSAAAEVGACPVDDLVAAAQAKYPKKIGYQEHHDVPKYLGGDPNGPTTRLPSAYHQLITNEFRNQWAYGQAKPSAEKLQEILNAVYTKYPISPFK